MAFLAKFCEITWFFLTKNEFLWHYSKVFLIPVLYNLNGRLNYTVKQPYPTSYNSPMRLNMYTYGTQIRERPEIHKSLYFLCVLYAFVCFVRNIGTNYYDKAALGIDTHAL